MTLTKPQRMPVSLQHLDSLYIGGRWEAPSGSDSIAVVDPSTEKTFLTVPEANSVDVSRAIHAARQAFDESPWPNQTPRERAKYLYAMADALERRLSEVIDFWPQQTGITFTAASANAPGAVNDLRFYAGLADTYPFTERHQPRDGGSFGLLKREAVGVVGAIVAWNHPLGLIVHKIAPALLAGCTIVLKCSPEAPAEGYLFAEIADEIGLPPGVFNVLTANREASEKLVTDARVDKIAFTGSTEAGRRIASLLGQRIGRYNLELGGKSAAVVLDDADLDQTASALVRAQCFLTGQVCSALTRVIVPRRRHDELVAALVKAAAEVRIGDPYDNDVDMGPLAIERQRTKVMEYVNAAAERNLELAAGGRVPSHTTRGWYVEPTIFANVPNSDEIARDEIFGPVLTVIPAENERDTVRIANDSIYGLNASVFTGDADRAMEYAGLLRSGTVGHNAFRTDLSIAFGGYKQSGIGREGGTEGLLPYLETKTIILNGDPLRQRIV